MKKSSKKGESDTTSYRGWDKAVASRYKFMAELVIVVVFAINASVVVFVQNRIDQFKDTRTFWSHAYQSSLTLQNAFINAKSSGIVNAEDYLKKAASEAFAGLIVHWDEFADRDQQYRQELAALNNAKNRVDGLDNFNAFMSELNRVEAKYVTGKSLEYQAFNIMMRSWAVYTAAIIFIFASLARAYFQYVEARSKA